MKPVLFFTCMLLFLYPAAVIAQAYIPSDKGSSVTFIIKNFGFNVEGSFKNLRGTINFDPANIKAASFNVTVDAATVYTGNSSRDSHLKKEEYFDILKHPIISFIADKTEKTAAGGYIVTGKFTIKEKSKWVSIPFTAMAQNNGYLFNGKIILNRRDFGVGGNSFVLSDNLTLLLSVFAGK